MEGIWILIILGGIWWGIRFLRASRDAAGGMNVPLTGRIPPSGECEFHVVGESYYQEHLKFVLRKLGRGDDEALTAFIVTEPSNPYDKNACAVYIAGGKVGHLSRDHAKEYIKQMKRNKIPALSRFQVAARLIGGQKGKPSIGVMLDLPLVD